MKIWIKTLGIIFALIIMVLPLLAGCTPQTQSTTAATTATAAVKKPAEVVIYDIADLSGPYAASMAPSVAGFDDYFKWYNQQGGMDGVKVRFTWLDTGGDKAKALTSYNKIREESPRTCFSIINSAIDSEMLAPRLIEDKLPMFTASNTAKSGWPPQWLFAETSSWQDLSGAFFDYLSASWSKSGKTEKCKVAFFGPDIPISHDLANKEVLEYLKTKPNIEIVATEYYDYKALDLSSDILKVMQSKPDYLYGFYFAASGVAFYKSIDALGLAGKVNIATAGWGMQPELVQQYGKKNVEGVIGPHCIPPFLPVGMTPVSKGMELVDKLWTENNRGANFRSSGYSNGVMVGFLMTNIINSAVKKVGWEKLDGKAVYDILVNTTDLNCGDIGVWGIQAGTRNSNKYQIQQFKDGVPLPITSWQTAPDLRPAVYRTAEYSWKAAGWPAGYLK